MSITGLLKIIDILYLILGLVVFLLYRDFLIYLVLVGGVYFLLSALYKAYSIGFDTLRGKFWVILSGFGLLGPGLFLHSYILSTTGRLFLLIAVLFMLLGIIKQGFKFRGLKLFVYLLVAIIVIAITFLAVKGTGYSILVVWIIDILIFLIILANFLAFLGGEMGRRWSGALLAVLFYLIGDLLYFYGLEYVSFVSYILTFFLTNLLAHVED